MKVDPARVPTYASTADMVANYRTIHATFWKPGPPGQQREVEPPEIGAARTDVRQTVGTTASARPEPEPEPDHEAVAAAITKAVYAAVSNVIQDLIISSRVAVGESVSDIMKATCLVFGIHRSDLLSRRRTPAVVVPRQIAMALCHHLTKPQRSYPEIGRRFGGYDHTTVLHADKRMRPVLDAVKDDMPADASAADWVRAMREHMGI